MKPVFDTNILIDYLTGKPPARIELLRYHEARISVITWIEVMAGARDKEDEAVLRAFLHGFETIPLDDQVAEIAVRIRKDHRLRLPDALIWAAAKSTDSVLITRDTRDYPADDPEIRVPYTL